MIVRLLSLICLLAVARSQDVIFDVAQYIDLDDRGSFGQIVTPEPAASTIRPVTNSELQTCLCVPYHECEGNTRLSDMNSNQKIEISFFNATCEHYLDVCCGGSGPSSVGGQVQPPVQPPPDQPPVRPVDQPNVPVTQPTRPVSVQPPVQPPNQFENQQNRLPGCGIRNQGGLDFSINDVNPKYAGFGEFPWTVAIIDLQTGICECAGSLITPSVVLTAAHCARSQQAGMLKVRAGEWDTQTTKERLPFQERVISQIVQHPNYNKRALYFDVAVAALETPFILADHIATVCLPPPNYQSFSKDCFAAGWGKDKFGKAGVYSVMLKKVQLPVVQNNECQTRLRQTRLSHRFILHPSFMCAGGQEGIDTCEGDGGAALACPVEYEGVQRYVQMGIVSWGIGCNTQVPAVYGNVAFVREWIDGTVQGLGFDISGYSQY